jgi:hypothetical protein
MSRIQDIMSHLSPSLPSISRSIITNSPSILHHYTRQRLLTTKCPREECPGQCPTKTDRSPESCYPCSSATCPPSPDRTNSPLRPLRPPHKNRGPFQSSVRLTDRSLPYHARREDMHCLPAHRYLRSSSPRRLHSHHHSHPRPQHYEHTPRQAVRYRLYRIPTPITPISDPARFPQRRLRAWGEVLLRHPRRPSVRRKPRLSHDQCESPRWLRVRYLYPNSQNRLCIHQRRLSIRHKLRQRRALCGPRHRRRRLAHRHHSMQATYPLLRGLCGNRRPHPASSRPMQRIEHSSTSLLSVPWARSPLIHGMDQLSQNARRKCPHMVRSPARHKNNGGHPPRCLPPRSQPPASTPAQSGNITSNQPDRNRWS